ncbi:hypothetical protein GGI25_004752 [Coemansia spiralis]|uniref:Uncharacterized protein n=2 Tax=Coemansia TaxID=4863 RepID=A0A9W8G3M3_9FUNG|nr:hypothetical protein BX070DRAFT_227185 [Coemansia spiralis]KAJ1989726.1 hypothetical protein EDC05_004524 [Coemansia umbellata]KAJ2620533.1 hypothetical protein GGI26_004940 [Coemansia sp. RSA 1358]KAJ2673417.1 hypothetical protein GGI25_004752 [Coemansia spiralis]
MQFHAFFPFCSLVQTLLTLGLCLSELVAVASSLSVPRMRLFGDSITDTGRLKSITHGIVPPKPYWQGRFSCGPVWCEWSSLLLGFNLENYAVGAAVTTDSHPELFGILPMSIPSTYDQIQSFLSNKDSNSVADTDIAILEIGGNDVMDALPDIISNKISVEAFAESLSSTVVSQLQDIKNAGFKTIYVTNIPALQYIPLMALEKRAQAAGTVVDAYNKKLSTKAASWATSSGLQNFGILDINAFMRSTLSRTVSSALGITDITGSCVGGNALQLFLGKNHIEALLAFALDLKGALLCSNPEEHFFWDPIHPNDRVHRLFGYYVYKAIKSSESDSLFAPSEANLLSLIYTYNLNSTPLKPAKI